MGGLGEKCVERFRGMFAFVLWDETKQTVLLARDRLGVKPLFYSLLPDGYLIVGSELKSLLAHGGLAREMDPFAVEDDFALGYIPEPRTIFKGAEKLPPAHTLMVRRGERLPAPREYWDVEFTGTNKLSSTQAQHELIERLQDSVRLRMISEVPLGAFLSGGVDSSAVVAMMAEVSADPINTCSISFAEPQYDESKYALQVAQRYRTRHFVDRVESEDFDLIDVLARMYDEPYADSSAIPTYRVCQLARRHVTVALSGDGGDESFGGYRRYRLHMMEERMRQPLPLALRRPMFGLLGRVYPKATGRRACFAARLLSRRSRGIRSRPTFTACPSCVTTCGVSSTRTLSRRDSAGYNAIEVFSRHALKANRDDPLSLIQYLDLKTYLVGDINTKVDRASMAHSLEVREPLMDHPLVEWLASLPSSFKLRNGEGKWLFKKSMETHLPSEILYRPKMGFAVPLAAWFRGPLKSRVHAALLGSTLVRNRTFQSKPLARSGRTASGWHTRPQRTALEFADV